MHGTLSPEVVDRLKPLRQQADLYFDSGDCIKTGNLGVPLKEEPVWQRLNELDCTASAIGNRETHLLESAFRKKLQGATHPILCANLHRKDGTFPLERSLVLHCQGLRIGVFAVMVPMVTEKMKTQAASTYLWDPPLTIAKQIAAALRPSVDLLIALTHIGYKQDLKLADECSAIDVILGGHSHTVLEEPVLVGNTYVCQGGSHSRFAGVYEWTPGSGIEGRLQPLN